MLGQRDRPLVGDSETIVGQRVLSRQHIVQIGRCRRAASPFDIADCQRHADLGSDNLERGRGRFDPAEHAGFFDRPACHADGSLGGSGGADQAVGCGGQQGHSWGECLPWLPAHHNRLLVVEQRLQHHWFAAVVGDGITEIVGSTCAYDQGGCVVGHGLLAELGGVAVGIGQCFDQDQRSCGGLCCDGDTARVEKPTRQPQECCQRESCCRASSHPDKGAAHSRRVVTSPASSRCKWPASSTSISAPSIVTSTATPRSVRSLW